MFRPFISTTFADFYFATSFANFVASVGSVEFGYSTRFAPGSGSFVVGFDNSVDTAVPGLANPAELVAHLELRFVPLVASLHQPSQHLTTALASRSLI